MDWIKVTPETMPPDMEPVLVTTEYDGKRGVIADVRYNPKYGWEVLTDALGDYWEDIREKVTHWMPFPEPAED